MNKPLKILIVSQYFWPENMRINDMVSSFVNRGHEVTVLTGLPNYPEGKVFSSYSLAPREFSRYRGASIVRVPMFTRGKNNLRLIFNYLSFFLSASVLGPFKLRGEKYDAIFVYAVSPIMAAIPAIVLGRIKKTPVFVWVLDLWPETLHAVGVIKKQWILSLVGKLVSWIYNRTDYLLLQSKSFAKDVKRYCKKPISEDRLVYFPSWAEDDFSSKHIECSTLVAPSPNHFTIVFAGNIGEAQNFPAVLDSVESLKPDLPIRWVIVGDGRASAWLQEQVKVRGLEQNVLLLGRHPLEQMPPLFATADALFLSLKTNSVFEKTIPGKIQAYLAAGKPIIAMVDGEAARVISEAGAGMACPSGDADGLVEIVRKMASFSKTKRAEMGRAGQKYYAEHYSKEMLFDRLESLFRCASLRKDEH